MEVTFDKIKIGERYGIVSYGSLRKVIGTCINYNGSFALFKIIAKTIFANRLYTAEYESIFYSGVGYNFYLLGQKESIQNAMELRALHKILENILGHKN